MNTPTLRLRKTLSIFCALFMAILVVGCKKETPEPTAPTPTSQNYKVYVGGQDNNLYAFNNDGTLVWKFQSNGNFSYSKPAIANGVIYSTNTDHNLYALDAALGTLKWKFETGSTSISSPAVSNGVVYFGSDDHIFMPLMPYRVH